MRYRQKVDRRWNKSWYFFMLVAAGLILSWGQVGNRYREHKPVETKEYLLLRTEQNCELLKAPCAAYAPDYALVINVEKNRGWNTATVRAAGVKLDQASRVKMSFEPVSSLYEPELLPVRFREPDSWYSDFQFPDNRQAVWKLRIKVDQSEKTVYVADFPLPAWLSYHSDSVN
jgi:hypothetical protein